MKKTTRTLSIVLLAASLGLGSKMGMRQLMMTQRILRLKEK